MQNVREHRQRSGNKTNPTLRVWEQAHLMPHIWVLISFPSFPLRVSSALFSSLFLYFFLHQSLHHFLHSHQNQDHFLNLHLKQKITYSVLVLKRETCVLSSAIAPLSLSTRRTLLSPWKRGFWPQMSASPDLTPLPPQQSFTASTLPPPLWGFTFLSYSSNPGIHTCWTSSAELLEALQFVHHHSKNIPHVFTVTHHHENLSCFSHYYLPST